MTQQSTCPSQPDCYWCFCLYLYGLFRFFVKIAPFINQSACQHLKL
ncbi:hypothetical protein EJK50_0506 [Moraxella catarrhalis]|nr:hypothetical protein EJK50_0506 [Moraxella catarrhalis]